MRGGQWFRFTWVQEKNSFSFQLTWFRSLPFPRPPSFPSCFGFTPKQSPSLLSFKLKWETTEFHLIFTQCYKSPCADLLHSAGFWRAEKPFGRAGRNIKFRFLMQPQKKKKEFSPDCTVLPLYGGRSFSFARNLPCVGPQVSEKKVSLVLLLENSLVP